MSKPEIVVGVALSKTQQRRLRNDRVSPFKQIAELREEIKANEPLLAEASKEYWRLRYEIEDNHHRMTPDQRRDVKANRNAAKWRVSQLRSRVEQCKRKIERILRNNGMSEADE